MSFLRYEKIIDKWQFGDVTREDLVTFAETEAYFNKKLKNTELLLNTLKEPSATWDDIQVSFYKLLEEMRKEIPSQSRLEYIRNLHLEKCDALIQSITDKEILNIARYDRGQSVDKYVETLNLMIFEQDGLINENQYFYPYEAIELGRYFCEVGQEREFAICNCLIAKNILFNTDGSNCISFLFEDVKRMFEFTKLPKDLFEVTMKILITTHRYEVTTEKNYHFFKDELNF